MRAKRVIIDRLVKPEVMWAIHGIHGFYIGTQLTRAKAIEQHCKDLDVDWEYCKNKGDRAIKVKLIAV